MKFRIAAAILAIASSAHAADIPRNVYKAPAYRAMPSYDWSGFQLGVQGGWGWAQTSWTNTTLNNFNTSGTINGGFAGIRGGYDYQIRNFVVGASAEYNWSGIKGQYAFITALPDSVKFNITQFGSVDGRIGYVFGSYLVYVIGGYAFGDQSNMFYGLSSTAPFSFGSTSLKGWDLGVGADFKIWDNLIARVEYRHYDFGSFDFPPTFPGFAAHRQTTKLDTVRAGLAYKF